MKFSINLFFGQCIIFWNQYHFISGNPLIGENVRAAAENEFRGVVSIQMITPQNSPIDDHVCTGTLISTHDVLTAEHCFSVVDQFNAFKVTLGTVDLLENSNFYPAWWLSYLTWCSQRGIHVQYVENDITLLRLTERVTIPFPPAVKSFKKASELFEKEVSMVGWGKLRNGTTTRYLQTATLTVLTTEDCDNLLASLRNEDTNIQEMYVCTNAQPFVLLTKGDSGGPLFYEGILVALNKAICPLLPNISEEQKVNLHVIIDFYRMFILHVQYVL